MALSKGKIYKYDLKGNFVAEYESATEASFINKISESYLLDHLKGKFSYCHKHIYTKKYYIKLPNELLENKTKRIYNTNKIYQYDIDGNFLNEYVDKNEAAKKTGLKPRYIRDFASGHCGKGKTYGGFIWSYEKKNKIPKFEKKINYKEIHQYSKNGKYIKTFDSIKQAAEEIKIHQGGISKCASGVKGQPTAGGFIWKYEKDILES
jgi:hypothetical protein